MRDLVNVFSCLNVTYKLKSGWKTVVCGCDLNVVTMKHCNIMRYVRLNMMRFSTLNFTILTSKK